MEKFDLDRYESYGDEDVVYSEDLPTLQGDGNSPPVQADTMPQRSNSLVDLLGSIGSTARDLGTAVGMTKRELSTVDDKFKKARDAQESGNSLSTWWQYTSTTDKVMIGLAAAGLVLVLYKGVK